MAEAAKTISKRFLITWLIIVLVMFSLSIIWHGIVLNDLERLDVPLQKYLLLSFFFYLLIGFILMYSFVLNIINIKKIKPILKGVTLGIVMGLLVYTVSDFAGFSFTSDLSSKQFMVDATWQAVEQGIGGIVMAIVYEAFNRGFFFFLHW